MSAPGFSPRDVYREDVYYRVIKKGARFEGLVYFGESAWSGYSRKLPVGSVVKCTGWRPGYGTLVDQVNFTDKRVPDNARWMQIWPMSGLFRPYPMHGYLLEMSTDEVLAYEAEERKKAGY